MRIMKCSLCDGWPHYLLKLREEWRGRCWAHPSDIQGHMKMVQSSTRGSLYLTLGSFSLLSVWSTTGTDYLQGWPMPEASQCLRGICTMPLTTFFIFGQPWSGQAVGLDDCCRCIPAEILKSRLDYTKEKKRNNFEILNVFVNKIVNKYIIFFSSRLCLEFCTAWTL